MKKLLLTLIGVMFLTSCATIGNIDENTVLNDDQGILVTNIECSMDGGGLLVYGANAPSKVAGFIDMSGIGSSDFLWCNDGVRLIILKEGDYYFGGVAAYGSTRAIDRDRAYKFSIEPNTLNYIGDHIITSPERSIWSGADIYVSLSQRDNEQKAIQHIKENTPLLLEKYAYKKGIAKK